jgi:oxygen-independent coproporphyrinogen-3 oxidase
LISEHIPHRLRVGHIHFGGGTPTILRPKTFVGLVTLLRQAFDVAMNAEIAVEIDPRTLGPDMIGALAASGLNRASIGIQSFDPAVQRAINRTQSFGQTAAVTAALRDIGVKGLNFDLVYGLPHQTVASCIETALRCIELRPDRFSVFGYAHVPGFKPHQRRIESPTLPNVAERYRQFEAIAEVLSDSGYQRVGVDHFCLPDDAMSRAQVGGTLRRNFQGYTTDDSDVLLGLGASAIGRTSRGYVQNEVGVRAYERRTASDALATVRGHVLTDEDRMRGEIIERIMCDFAADLGQICERYRRQPDRIIERAARLNELLASGVATRNGTKLRVPDETKSLARIVAATFDEYMGTSGASHSLAM